MYEVLWLVSRIWARYVYWWINTVTSTISQSDWFVCRMTRSFDFAHRSSQWALSFVISRMVLCHAHILYVEKQSVPFIFVSERKAFEWILSIESWSNISSSIASSFECRRCMIAFDSCPECKPGTYVDALIPSDPLFLVRNQIDSYFAQHIIDNLRHWRLLAIANYSVYLFVADVDRSTHRPSPWPPSFVISRVVLCHGVQCEISEFSQ